MVTNANRPLQTLIGKLSRLASLDDLDIASIGNLPYRIQIVPPAHYLVREGCRVSECCLLVEGHAFRSKIAADGGRQIVSFHMPGDLLDIQHLLLPLADHSVQTMTAAAVAWIPMDPLKKLAWDRPCVGEALWRDSLLDAAIFREWVLNVGRRDAKARIAHMLCEFAARRDASGVAAPDWFELPMTQEQIADATGLTSVHVNRMLRALREDGAIDQKGKQLVILDWERMCTIAGFDPAYLHAAA